MEERRSVNNREQRERRAKNRRHKLNSYIIKLFSPLPPREFAQIFSNSTALKEPQLYCFGNDNRHPIHVELNQLAQKYRESKLDIPPPK